MNRWLERLGRALRLEAGLFAEVAQDRSATLEAAAVILLVSLAAAIGHGGPILYYGGWGAFGRALLAGGGTWLLLWLMWAALVFGLGRTLLRVPAARVEFGGVARALGFAAAPGMARFFACVPRLDRVVILAAALWSVTAMIVATRQVFQVSTPRAVGLCLAGWGVQWTIRGLASPLLR